MVRIDGNKLQEIKDHFQEQAQREIAKAVQDPDTELKDDDIEAIKNKWKFQSNHVIQSVLELGPEKQFKQGYALDPSGWRAGYTKPTIAQRTTPRRAKNKASKQARKLQRRLQNK